MAPFTNTTAVHETCPASLATWQIYLPECDGFTECNCRVLEEESFLMKQLPPVKISFSSRNHLTLKLGVPANVAFNATVEPGITS